MAVNTVRIKSTSRDEGSRLKGQRVQGRILGKDGRQKQGRMGRSGGGGGKQEEAQKTSALWEGARKDSKSSITEDGQWMETVIQRKPLNSRGQTLTRHGDACL
jgi:hypothetical protein